ncbi:MAG: TIGR03545 family protein [Planctomycetia bacterium]|nr:TIGR03545 family protein [Planctomycetia bacterium]
MRWSYILPRVILLGLVWAFFKYGFDPLVHRGMIYSGQRAAQAKVEINGLSTTFFAPSIKANGVQVANRKKPGTNLIEFADLRGNLETAALLKKSFIVEEATLSGLRWGTKRADSGLLPGDKLVETDDSHSELLDNLKLQLLANGKDWLAGLAERAKLDFDPQQFETVRLGQELEERWPKEFGEYEEQFKALKAEIDQLRKALKVKGGNELEKIDRYARAAQDAERMLHELEQIKPKLQETMRQAKDDLQALNEAKSNDLNKLKEKADLLRLDPNEVSELLLGPQLTNRLETAIGWAKFLKERIQLATDDPKPERMRGETIFFRRKQELPLMLVRLLNVDGEGDFNGEQLAFKGAISGITTNPKIHGKPIIVRLDGISIGEPGDASAASLAESSTFSEAKFTTEPATKNSAKSDVIEKLTVNLKAVFDYTKAVPEHELSVVYKEPKGAEQNLGKPESIQLAMTSRATNCRADLKMIGDELSGDLNFQQALDAVTAKLGTKPFKNDQIVLKVVQDVVSSVNKIDAHMKLSGTAFKPHFKLKSSLGADLSSGLNTAFARQLEDGKRKLVARFDQETTKQSARLSSLYNEQFEKLTGQLGLNKSEIQEIAQSFGLKMPGKFDLKGIASGLPIDLNKSLQIDPNNPLNLGGLTKNLPKPDSKLPTFGLSDDSTPPLTLPPFLNSTPAPKGEGTSPAKPTNPIQQASEIEQGLESLFGKKKPKKTPAKSVQPAVGEKSKP